MEVPYHTSFKRIRVLWKFEKIVVEGKERDFSEAKDL